MPSLPPTHQHISGICESCTVRYGLRGHWRLGGITIVWIQRASKKQLAPKVLLGKPIDTNLNFRVRSSLHSWSSAIRKSKSMYYFLILFLGKNLGSPVLTWNYSTDYRTVVELFVITELPFPWRQDHNEMFRDKIRWGESVTVGRIYNLLIIHSLHHQAGTHT